METHEAIEELKHLHDWCDNTGHKQALEMAIELLEEKAHYEGGLFQHEN